jgi:hypothetical protein
MAKPWTAGAASQGASCTLRVRKYAIQSLKYENFFPVTVGHLALVKKWNLTHGVLFFMIGIISGLASQGRAHAILSRWISLPKDCNKQNLQDRYLIGRCKIPTHK